MTFMLLAAAAFDPEAATRAYLASLQGAARARSDAYFVGGYWVMLWSAAISVVICWAMLRFGWSARWSAWAAGRARRPALRAALYSLPFVLVTALLSLPWSIYAGFVREHQYGLSNQNIGGWAVEQAIGLSVSLLVTPLLVAGLFAVIRRSPQRWWLWGTGVLGIFAVIGLVVGPVFVAPLFNRYQPLEPGPAREQILAMAHANKVPADNVYVFDASKQSKRISANVSGLGPTIRISLNDNLLNRTSLPEIKAVMGHELGHYVLHHVWQLLAAFMIVFLFGLLIAWWIAPRLLARYGALWRVYRVDDPAALPLLSAIGTIYFLAMTPVTNTITRTEEIAADAFGLDAAREPDGFAAVAMKLGEYRKVAPGPVEEFIFFDHPSGENRVRRAMEWKARHMPPAP